jgi:hypothetical protein
MVGGQYAIKKVSIFGQASTSLTQTQFLGYNGRANSYSYEIGIRYNAGTSIDKE